MGDDAEATPLRLTDAQLVTGVALPVPRLGQVGPLTLPARGPLRVEVTLADPQRLAVRVTAHEG